MSYESAVEERRKRIGGRLLVDSWPSEEVPSVWSLKEVYEMNGSRDVIVVPQLTIDGTEMPTRLDVYAKRNGPI